jgi:oxygen-independent coproporphyrinogen III oxidase
MQDTKTLALNRAEQGLKALDLPDLLSVLHNADIHIKRRIVGGSHSVVTYPPLNALQPVNPDIIVPKLQYGKHVHLYVHIAYCETHCTFCHYSVGVYRGMGNSQESQYEEVAHYLKALKREMRWHGERLRKSGTTISSIYIGGGTPLILEQEQLADLIESIRKEFTIESNVEFCIEGSPLTITATDGEEKLRFLRDIGVTRLSFGIQSFNNEVLRLAGRGYKHEVAIRACEIANDIFQNWNLDLIQSLAKGNVDEVWENLQALDNIKPPHLTYYHGRFTDHVGQGKRLLSRVEDFESEWDTLLGRMMIWQHLAELGYHQTDGNRFVRGEQFIDPFKKSRTSVSNDLLGIGASSYSHTSDWFFRNVFGKQEYVKMVESGKYPITTAWEITPEEQLAASYVVGLRTERIEGLTSEKEENHYQQLEHRLRALGLTEEFSIANAKGVRLTQLGQLFEDEVLSLFYSPAVLAALNNF